MASDSQDERYQRHRSTNDPYNAMPTSDISPRHSIIENGSSRNSLSQAEAQATKSSSFSNDPESKSNSAVNKLRNSENNQPSDSVNNHKTFQNLVKGVDKQTRESSLQDRKSIFNFFRKKSNQSSSNKSFFRRSAPLTFIFSLILGGAALFMGSQSLLGPHISSLYTKATDVQYTSFSMRNQRLMSYLIDGGNKIKVSNFTKRYTTFSPFLKNRLSKYHIEVGHLDDTGNFVPGQKLMSSKNVLKYNDKIIDANSFQTEFINDANFRESYYRARRGRVAGFFDDAADRFYKKRGATRDIFDSFKSTGDQEADKKQFEEIISGRITGSDASIEGGRRTTNEDGEEVIEKNGETAELDKLSGDTPELKARALVNNIAGKVSDVGVPICSALRIANIAAVTVSAYQISQSVAYFLSFMEPINKMMVGEGDTSAINETLNFLTTSQTSELEYVDEEGNTQTKTLSGSPLDSTGSKVILGQTAPDFNDTLPFSFDGITRAANRVALSTGATNTTCAGVQAASAVVSLASSAIPGGKLAKFIIFAATKAIGGVVITGIVSAVIQAILPQVARLFIDKIFENRVGIEAGELFSQGAATANFSLAKESSAYMPTTEDTLKTQNRNTTAVLREEAEHDRNNHHPLDPSNPNTFLGSLFSKFAFLSSTRNFINSFASFNSIFAHSLNNLKPFASAADDTFSYTSNYQACSNYSDAICDIYGTPIPSYDYSTIDISPDDAKYQAAILPNLNDDGSIKEDSELSKFIHFCKDRESPWFVKDANILNSLQTDFGIANHIIFVEDIADLINAAEDVANEPWGTGEICFNSSNNPRWENEFKYYQLYINDMRLLYGTSNSDEGEKNPVIALEESYAKSHPVDNSFVGTLARYSGQTKDDIAFILEYINYSNQIAEYNPTNLLPLKTPPQDIYTSYSNSNEASLLATIIYTPNYFIDKRGYIV